jgi:hypothetical protein
VKLETFTPNQTKIELDATSATLFKLQMLN